MRHYQGQLSALHSPCSKFGKQRGALFPRHSFTSVTGGHPSIQRKRWLHRVVFCRCEYLLAVPVSAH